MAGFYAFVASFLLGGAFGAAASNPIIGALVAGGLWIGWCAFRELPPPPSDTGDAE